MTVTVYHSFADVPLDDPPLFEGDDSVPIDGRYEIRGLSGVHPLEKPANVPLVVPYPGELHEGARGDHVYAIKRIVHRADGTLASLMLAPPKQRRTWGLFFTAKLRRVQKRYGIPRTGVWDLQTHGRLGQFADQLAVHLLQPVVLTERDRKRSAVLSFLMAFYNARYTKAYSQLRPTQLRTVRAITRADCSGSVATGMWTAHLVIAGVNWAFTNTGSQIELGIHVPADGPFQVGDVAFYGRGGRPGHETCIVDPNPHAPRVFSFGSYPAKILDLDYPRGDLGGRIEVRRFIT